MIAAIRALAATALIASARAYQLALSPWLGANCRFEPRCSTYFIEAVRRHGPIRGIGLGTGRLVRCHPLHPGGLDPVP